MITYVFKNDPSPMTKTKITNPSKMFKILAGLTEG